MAKNANRLAAVLLMGLAVAAPLPALAAECPAERAVYGLETEDGPLELGFIPARSMATIASDLYLYLTTPQRTYWFTFSVSNGYSGMTLWPVSDPRGPDAEPDGPRQLLDLDAEGEDLAERQDVARSLRFYALDEDLTFWFVPPNTGEPAPHYVMMPEIGLTLWYSPKALTEDATADRDPIPRGIFQQTACLDEPRAPAWP